jgi:hypothetical protein
MRRLARRTVVSLGPAYDPGKLQGPRCGPPSSPRSGPALAGQEASPLSRGGNGCPERPTLPAQAQGGVPLLLSSATSKGSRRALLESSGTH